MTATPHTRFVTQEVVAASCEVDPDTVRRWANGVTVNGVRVVLRTEQVGPRRRIPREAVAEFHAACAAAREGVSVPPAPTHPSCGQTRAARERDRVARRLRGGSQPSSRAARRAASVVGSM